MKRHRLACFLLLVVSFGFAAADRNGGIGCAVCSYLVGMGEQLSQVHSEDIVSVIDRYMCQNMPAPIYRRICDSLLARLGPYLIDEIYQHESPDTVCHKAGLCHQDPETDFCHVFPLPSSFSSSENKLRFHPRAARSSLESRVLEEEKKKMGGEKVEKSWCDWPALKEICDMYDRFKSGHLPFQDGDTDRYSVSETLRGSHWRGKDCNDKKDQVYPGRLPEDHDKLYDSNCNGIHGSDYHTGTPFEDLFCNGTVQMGVIALGDSASAHFHIPASYLEADKLDEHTFKHLPMVVENEFDWPQLSAITGFLDNEWPDMIEGEVNSIYRLLRANNRCNHRDYQNIAVNGAKSSSIGAVAETIARRNDRRHRPALVNLALIGNDVCNGDDDTLARQTQPEDYRRDMLATLRKLDAGVLPNGSFVALSGLADGRILWDTMNDRVHPIGKLNGDVKYSDVYAWLKCLGLSPCVGWMNKNETVRNLTSKRAAELSAVGRNISETEKFNNFKVYYYDYDINALLKRWEAQGGEAWQIIDPVDGFHPNQNAQFVYSTWLWEQLQREFPAAFAAVNPRNRDIETVFGDQGGYL